MSLAERAADEDERAAPPFDLRRPATLRTPVVFTSPHSGRLYPQRMMALSRLDARAVRMSEDAFVDELIAPAEDHGVALMLATHARAYVDVNRGAGEIDPDMFEGSTLQADVDRTARTAAGLGCIARVVGHGREIYRGKLPAGEAERRLEEVWRPWHAALDGLLSEAKLRFGVALLVDWHSMPSAVARAEQGRRAPDVVLGDRFGMACAPAVTALVQGELSARGYVVARNAPYAGGWTTERYGQPQHGLHALQIEVSRRLYLDEERLRPSPGFNALQRDVAYLARRLANSCGAWT